MSTYKRFFTIILLVLSLFLSSCRGNGNEPINVNEPSAAIDQDNHNSDSVPDYNGDMPEPEQDSIQVNNSDTLKPEQVTGLSIPEFRNHEKFSLLPFYLPETDELKTFYQTFSSDMIDAKSAQEQIELMIDFDRMSRHYHDMSHIANIRYTQNVNDETKADDDYFSSLYASVAEEEFLAYKAIVESVFIEELEEYFGTNTINSYRHKIDYHSPSNSELSNIRNSLENEYIQLLSAYLPKHQFVEEANAIYNELLTINGRIAEMEGYDSFPEYNFGHGISISLEDIEEFLTNIKQTVLPVFQQLMDSGPGRSPAARHKKTVYEKADTQRMYDLSKEALCNLFDEMSLMFDFLEQHEMMDVMPGKNKYQGAFVYNLPGIQVPFVYIIHPLDAETIFHEFGHALEFFELPESDLSARYSSTTLSSEFSSIVESLLENAMFCEFELMLYRNPEMTEEERRERYNALTDEYRLYSWRFTSWSEIPHYFTHPLYTISYSLNYVAAFELYIILQEDLDLAKEIYLSYIRGGLESDWVTRLENAGLKNPIEKQNLEELADFLSDYFSSDKYQNPF